MSLKTKLTSLITTFVLLCSLLTVGVFAVKNTTFNVGGDIVFDVKGIEADIELTANGVQNAVLADNAVAGTDVMNKIEIRNNTSAESVASQFAKWSDLNMTFAEGQSTATIELKISNVATEEDNYVDITALADATTKNNATIIVRNNAGGVTALLKKGESATFTITMSVIDDEYKANLSNFEINFDMIKKGIADFPEIDENGIYQTLKFTANADGKTMSVTDAGASDYNYQSTGNVVIPGYVKSNGVIYPVTKLGNRAFGSPTNGACVGVTLPETIVELSSCSLSTVTMTYLKLPSAITSIPGQCFVNCNIGTLEIPEGVTSIENMSFDISVVEVLIIPISLTSVGHVGFYGNLLIKYRGTEAQWQNFGLGVGIGSANGGSIVVEYNYAG